MTTLADIVNKEIELKSLFSEPLKRLIASSGFEFEVVNDNDDDQSLLQEVDSLIEYVFPPNEASEYKASRILQIENTLCIACLYNGVVQGCIVVNFDFNDNTVVLSSLAVDEQFRLKKMGSILMLALHDLGIKLDITSISLISSNAGMPFYESFGFQPMAHNSYEISLPFSKEIIAKKTSTNSFQEKTTPVKKRALPSLRTSSIFKSIETENNNPQENDKEAPLVKKPKSKN